MKKTIIALLALGGIAMGADSSVVVDVTDVTSSNKTTSFTSMTSGTVAVTLNVEAFKSLGGEVYSGSQTVLFKLTGEWEDGQSGSMGVANNGDASKNGLYGAWTKNNNTISYSSVNMDNCFSANPIDWDNVAGMTMVITYNEGPANYENVSKTPCLSYSTSVSYLYKNGSIVTTGAEKNDLYRFTIKEGQTVVDMVNVFAASGLEVNDTYVDSYTVYSGYLNFTDAKALSAARVVPEPTTATLSLLALAGLAARRRRR